MIFMRRLCVGIASALLVFSYGGIAYAHTTGASWNTVVGQYTADLGYDPATFAAGQYTRFDFLLWKGPANTGTPADFSQIWVRIVRDDNDTLLATGIWKQPVGPTTLLFEFTEPGSYKLEASYRDVDGNDIAVASFPITVAAGSSSSGTFLPLLIAILAFIAGGAAAVIVLRARSR